MSESISISYIKSKIQITNESLEEIYNSIPKDYLSASEQNFYKITTSDISQSLRNYYNCLYVENLDKIQQLLSQPNKDTLISDYFSCMKFDPDLTLEKYIEGIVTNHSEQIHLLKQQNDELNSLIEELSNS
jgi:hypothetical protein